MKITSGWLKERLRRTMLSDQSLVRALERAGIEVEQVNLSKAIDKRVVVALVKKVVQHPGADRLKLVDVQTSDGIYKIVCGAPNVKEGMKVALAQVGASLPSGDVIEKAKLRGELSEGMLCSELELGLGQDHGGIMELDSDAVLGLSLSELYPSESVIDIKTPANRWDLQSISGVAREVAAMTDETFVPLDAPGVVFSANKSMLASDIEASRYILTRLKINQRLPSPAHVTARLRAVGMRSIGTVVDITNYVMIETGQPLHAFDAQKVSLPICVRYASKDETLTTLDGIERKLSKSDLVIADSGGPIALAGLMGGKATEVSERTQEILLESAVFDAVVVRKMAQRHGLRTEASSRYERGIPVVLPPLGLSRAVELLEQSAGAELIESQDAPYGQPASWDIALSISKISAVVGFGVLHKNVISALAKLAIPAKQVEDKVVVDEVPWWRPDLKEPEDLIEEFVRIIGYDNIPSTIPSWKPVHIDFDRSRSVRRRIQDIVWASGAFEVMTYSFVSGQQLMQLGLNPSQHLKLKNPLSTEQEYLRSNLLPSHLATLERNRMYAKRVKFFEISNVFIKKPALEQPEESLRLGLSVLEPKGSYSVAKGVLDAICEDLNIEVQIRPFASEAYAPARAAEIWLGSRQVGTIGQVHPNTFRHLKIDGEVAHLEIELPALIDASSPRRYVASSVYPTISRDLALLMPAGISWQDIWQATKKWNILFVSNYYGTELPQGMKSMTIRLTLALPDRTPTEAEASELEEAVLIRLGHKFGAQRRT